MMTREDVAGYCIYCGSPLRVGHNYCMRCGKPASHVEQPALRQRPGSAPVQVGQAPVPTPAPVSPGLQPAHGTLQPLVPEPGYDVQDTEMANLPQGFGGVGAMPLSDEDEVTEVVRQPRYLLRPAEGTVDAIPLALPCVIGRSGTKSDIKVSSSKALSRAHARVSMAGDSVVVDDLNSTNGTFVNGVQVVPGNPLPIAPGSKLTLGNVDFAFEATVA